VNACDNCLEHALLLERLAGHIEAKRSRLDALLAHSDDELIGVVGGSHADDLRRDLARRNVTSLRERSGAAGLRVVCRCSPAYPATLRELAAPPSALFLTAPPTRLAELLAEPAAAIVGARRASPYGREAARALAGGLAGAGVTVVSGMALGIDGVAHDGALRAGRGGAVANGTAGASRDDAQGPAPAMPSATVAVLAGGADVPYPASHRRLYARIRAEGVLVSELPPGIRPRRWMFPARNRIIAGLSAMTVVVQARPQSGALVTARYAGGLGRTVGAVPGPISSPLSAGPHELIRAGARLIAGPQDVLDALFGPGRRSVADARRARLSDDDASLLAALREGHEGAAAFARAGLAPAQGLEAVTALELAGLVTRAPGGRLVVAAE
jgi:DNA processing protein